MSSDPESVELGYDLLFTKEGDLPEYMDHSLGILLKVFVKVYNEIDTAIINTIYPIYAIKSSIKQSIRDYVYNSDLCKYYTIDGKPYLINSFPFLGSEHLTFISDNFKNELKLFYRSYPAWITRGDTNIIHLLTKYSRAIITSNYTISATFAAEAYTLLCTMLFKHTAFYQAYKDEVYTFKMLKWDYDLCKSACEILPESLTLKEAVDRCFDQKYNGKSNGWVLLACFLNYNYAFT